MFETDTGLYSGIVKTMATDRGREFYDITEIQKEGDLPTRGDNGLTPPPARTETPSELSIPQTSPGVNPEAMVGYTAEEWAGLLEDAPSMEPLDDGYMEALMRDGAAGYVPREDRTAQEMAWDQDLTETPGTIQQHMKPSAEAKRATG